MASFVSGMGSGGAAVVDTPPAGGAAGGGAGAGGGEGTTPPGHVGEGGGDGVSAPGESEGGTPGEGDQPGGEGDLEVEENPESDIDPETEDVDTDGRKLDLKTREALAKLKKSNPAAAKRLAGTYFRASTIAKELGAANLSEAITKVRDMSATLESLGGEDGIQEMQSEISDYRTEIDQFAHGDPALLEQLNSENPEAFATAISNGLGLVAKNPEAFNKLIYPHVADLLDKSGVLSSMANLMAFIKDGKGQEAWDLGTKLEQWLKGAKAFGDKSRSAVPERNPEREAINRERQELDLQKRANFEQGVGTDVNRQNNVNTTRVVEPFFKQMKLSIEGRREFVNALNSRVYKLMESDQGFQRNATALMDKGDSARVARFIAAKFNDLLPEQFRKLRDAMYPNWKPAVPKKAAPAAGGSNNGAARPAAGGAGGGTSEFKTVNAKPPAQEIDWSKTTDEMFHIGRGIGKAILKDGKKVQWDWAKI